MSKKDKPTFSIKNDDCMDPYRNSKVIIKNAKEMLAFEYKTYGDTDLLDSSIATRYFMRWYGIDYYYLTEVQETLNDYRKNPKKYHLKWLLTK